MGMIFLRNRVSGGAPAFDPATLFGVGDNGGWYDPSDLATVWTDTAGTTQATAVLVGQTPSTANQVARIDDKSGNSNHLIQATSAARPILRVTAGGLYFLDFDGVDDQIKHVYSVDLAQPVTSVLALSSNVAGGTILGVSGSGSDRQILYNANPFYVFGGTQFGSGALPVATEMVLNVVWNGTSSSYTVDNGTPVTGDVGSNTRGEESLGGRNSDYKNMDYYGHITIDRTLTAQEISDIEAYLAAKAGVTL